MVRVANSRIRRQVKRKNTFEVTLPKDLVEDDTFPFKEDDQVVIRIDGSSLRISKNGDK
ncbi:hypothetical protein MUP07_00680 [Candidatus Bathyarchaeota archaeon]|nr:hypothetical protein [Candidatus Bathyarchaeota archaeon]